VTHPLARGWDFDRVWRLSALAGIAQDVGRILREQRLEGPRLRALQEAKLRRLLAHAYRSVPYYRNLFNRAGLKPEDVRGLADLPRLPITRRAELQSHPQEMLLSTDFAATPLRTATTTGSTGRPLSSRQEAGFDRWRRALFLRALWAGGYRVGMKIALVDGTSPRSAPRWTRLHYIPQNLPGEVMLDAIDRIRPTVLYTPLSPLRQLVDLIRLERRRHHRPPLVFTTSEILEPTTRRLLRDVLGAEVFDLYGSTELGVIAWECEAHAGYHIAEDGIIVELVPDAQGGPPRIIATNLELMAMPLIRYETGDRGAPGPEGRCACGRASARLGLSRAAASTASACATAGCCPRTISRSPSNRPTASIVSRSSRKTSTASSSGRSHGRQTKRGSARISSAGCGKSSMPGYRSGSTGWTTSTRLAERSSASSNRGSDGTARLD
jgi:phenylacetate-coenzyme A ligase PaaK-like adenylate-forming protein